MRILYKKGTQLINMIEREGLNVDFEVFEDDNVNSAINNGWFYTPWEAYGQDEEGNEVKKQRGRQKAEV